MNRIASSLAAAVLGAAVAAPDASAADTVALFDPTAFETPESIAVATDGAMYISMALTGEVRKIERDGTQSTLAHLPIRPDIFPCGNAFGVAIMGGLCLDHQGNLYVSVGSCDPALIGVWKVTPAGETSLLAPLGATALPNGIAFHAGFLYVADTNLGQVWRIPAAGGPAEVWASDPLLAPLPDFFPGPNGLQIFHNEVYVAVSDRAHVVAFWIERDGSAGPARVHATGVGLDDFAFDVEGNLYGTTDPFNTVLRVRPDGSVETLLTAADGLDGPTAAAFGRGEADQTSLYITNAAFPFFSTTHRPSLMRLEVGIPGKPRP
jgi:sugar lactone lactonase YvrE